MATDPTRSNSPLRVDVAAYDANSLRLGWAATSALDYEILVGDSPGGPSSEVIHIPGRFPEADWVVPVDPGVNRFFRVEEVAPSAIVRGASSP
jgi:hypothetical protein